MTYKVLLVDDEYYIRQRLKTCIEWEKEGFEIHGEAQSADDALKILERENIDMAVVDISMPGKDGLTLLKELREKKLSVKIIILSGYGTFAYAQKAIEYGVNQYLLKPIDEDELIQSLKQLRHVLDSEYALKNIRHYKQKADRLLTVIRKENYFKKIFTPYVPPESLWPELEHEMGYYGLSSDSLCRILIFDLGSQYLQTLDSEDLQLFRYAVGNILCELTQTYFKVICAVDLFGHGVLICNPKFPEEDTIIQYMETAAQKVRELLKMELCFGTSPFFFLSLPELNKAYQKALSSYVTCNLSGRTWVSPIENDIVTSKSFSVIRALERIDTCFSSRSQEELEQSLHLFFSALKEQTFSFYMLEQALSRLFMIYRKSDTSGNLVSLPDISYLTNFKEILFSGYDIAYLNKKIIPLFLARLETPQITSTDVKEALIQDAARFIETHYSRCDMSLTLLSQNLLVSPSYLSSLFKKIKGVSINQYLTQCRLHKAKELLVNTNLTLTEIAERVGYNDMFYFSKVFKKNYGISPSSYRQTQ